jgi:hypothetical protein
METIRLCKEASQSGGNFALVLPPSYYKSLVTSELLMQHFTQLRVPLYFLFWSTTFLVLQVVWI